MFEVYAVEDGELVRYVRRGECRRCGACCCAIAYQFAVVMAAEQSEQVDWTQWEGWSVFRAFGVWWYVRVKAIDPAPCPQLRAGGCAVYGDAQERGPLCWHWPVHPDNLFPGCGFTFEREEG